jgi:hypothetical protein
MKKLLHFEDFLNEAKVEVDISTWKNSTGKSVPSVYGSWMFFKDKECRIRDKEENIDYVSFTGKYNDAKNKAKDWAKKLGYDRIYVGG